MSLASRCAKTRGSWTRSPKARGCTLECGAESQPLVLSFPRKRRRPVGIRLLRNAQELLALVAAFEQPSQRLGRVLEAVLHVDLGLKLSRLHPAGERRDRLGGARHVIEHEEAFHPPALHDQVEVVLGSAPGPIAL